MRSAEISEEEILAKRTPQGGWTRDVLAAWGVPWPPPRGWKIQLLRHGVPFQRRRTAEICGSKLAKPPSFQ